MSLTTKMLNNAGAGTVFSTDAGQFGTTVSGNFVNGVLQAQRVKDRSGLLQVGATTGQTATVTLQGRPDPTAPWVDLAGISQADWNTDPNFTFAKVVTLMPELRIKSVHTAGASPAINAWLTE